MKTLLMLLFLAGPQDSIDDLIEKLGSASIVERDEAAEELAALGVKSLPALRKAGKAHEDPEVRARVKAIVKQLTTVHWVRDITSALKTSKATGKPIFVFSTGGELEGYA